MSFQHFIFIYISTCITHLNDPLVHLLKLVTVLIALTRIIPLDRIFIEKIINIMIVIGNSCKFIKGRKFYLM